MDLSPKFDGQWLHWFISGEGDAATLVARYHDRDSDADWAQVRLPPHGRIENAVDGPFDGDEITRVEAVAWAAARSSEGGEYEVAAIERRLSVMLFGRD
jgi:hypothetical protein